MSQIIALKKAIEDAETGSLSDYHVLTRYYVDETSNYVEVGFATYVSEKMYLAGRRAVGNGIVLKMNRLNPRFDGAFLNLPNAKHPNVPVLS